MFYGNNNIVAISLHYIMSVSVHTQSISHTHERQKAIDKALGISGIWCGVIIQPMISDRGCNYVILYYL